MKKTRNFQYDLIRFVAMIFIVCLHSEALTRYFVHLKPHAYVISCILISLFTSGTYIFFMLSGKFALCKKFDDKVDYITFYLKKLFTILIPFVIISFLFLAWTHRYSIGDLWRFYYFISANKVEGSYWFVYILIALIISTPFLAKMIRSWSNKDKKYFFVIGCCVETYILFNMIVKSDTSLNLGAFPLMEWTYFYILGYIAEDLFDQKARTFFIWMVPLTILLKTILQCLYGSVFTNGTHILTTIEVLGLYFFILDKMKVKNEKCQKVIQFTAKHGFMVYLIHPMSLIYLNKALNFTHSLKMSFVSGVIMVLVAFLSAFFVGWIFDTLLFDRISNYGDKVIKKVKKRLEISNEI